MGHFSDIQIEQQEAGFFFDDPHCQVCPRCIAETDHRRATQGGRRPLHRGLRIPVAAVVGMVAEGMTSEGILEAYPDLQRDDVREALEYAAEAVRERELPLRRGA